MSKNKILSILLTTSMTMSNILPVFAATAAKTPHTVPVSITNEALTYNVEVSEALFFNFEDGITDDADVTIENKSPVGVIEVTGIENVGMENDYVLKNVGTEDYWKQLPLNSKQIAIQYNGDDSHDFSLGALYDDLLDVDPESNGVLNFTGFTGGVTEEESNLQVNSFVLTVGFRTAAGAEADDPTNDPSTLEWDVSASDSDDVTATLDPDTGNMLIDGSGNMADYDTEDAPYEDHKDEITSVEVADGVNNIGNSAFEDCKNLTDVDAPNIDSVGDNAFNGCDSLDRIDVSGATDIGDNAIPSGEDVTVVAPSGSAAEDYANQNGNTVEEPAGEAVFLDGISLNIKMKTLAGDLVSNYDDSNNSIISILESKEVPSEENTTEANLVSIAESEEPIYMWFNDGTIYWYSNDKTPKITDACAIFNKCHNLVEIDGIKNWDVSDCEDFSIVFCECSALVDISVLANWDVHSARVFDGMFEKCTNLESIAPLQHWDVSNAYMFTGMFTNCYNIKDVTAINEWNIVIVNGQKDPSEFECMFKNCPSHPEFTKVSGTWFGGTFTPSTN